MILDTNALSALLRGEPNLVNILRSIDHHNIPAIVLGEYRYGLMQSCLKTRIETVLDELERESIILAIDKDTARTYADLRTHLRQAGTPVPENDVWIGALALQHRLPVITRDRHFAVMPDIKTMGW